jgi:hypothetical protein
MKRLSSLLPILLLAGCATHPLVRTDYDPAVDFSRYHSYAWQQEPAISNPLVKQRLVAAIDASLAGKGWVRVPEGGAADVALVGNVATREKQTIETFYGGPRWNDWSWRQDWTGPGVHPDMRITSYTVGTFVLDMFDVGTRQGIWRGSAEGQVPDSPEKVTRAVNNAVERMFADFPPAR